MKQLDDISPSAQADKPTRGRPRKAGALTGAQRAKKFRDARRAQPKFVTVTKNECSECAALRDEVRKLKLLVVIKEIQALADGVRLKKARATVLELRRELVSAKQPANKRHATDVAFLDVVTSIPGARQE